MWFVEHADGSVSQHHDRPGTAGVDAGVRNAAIPRELDLLCERWDFEAGQIVALAEGKRARIDQAYLADLGANAIAAARAAKAAEARLIMAGIAVDGIVAAEAAAIGVAVHDRAAQIVAAAQDDIAREVARIVAKREAGD